MKKMFLRVIALVLTICAMQCCLVPAVFAEDTENKKPQPILVKESLMGEWKDGNFSAITKGENGHDYLALPIYGGKMYIYDLDELRLEDVVETEITTPHGATVDKDGVIWVSGTAGHLYRYDVNTHTGAKTKNFAGEGSTTGIASIQSAFAITQGTDGCLYFGTYASCNLLKYDIKNDTFTKINYTKPSGISSVQYITAVVQKGDYIYAAMHTSSNDYLVKLNADTYQYDSYRSIDTQMGSQRYLRSLEFLDYEENIVVGTNTKMMFAFDLDTMQSLSYSDFNIDYSFSIKGSISEEKNGYVYFTTYEHGYCSYDLGTNTVSSLNGKYNIDNTQSPVVRCNAGNFVTMNVKNGVAVSCDVAGSEKVECMILFNNSKAALQAYDVIGKKQYILTDRLIASDAGGGTDLRALIASADGSTLYTGAFSTDQVYTYDIETGSVSSLTASSIQTDAIHCYKNKIYAGNYNTGQLTEINPDRDTNRVLFTLNDAVFDQSRIHTITAGDNMVFAGTCPDVYKNGGMIAWYDLNGEKAYAAVGPDPEDVFFLQDGKWYNEKKYKDSNGATLEERKDGVNITLDDTGIEGVIYKHSINSLVYYKDGILFGTSSYQGGTSSDSSVGKQTRAVVFAYDVNSRKVIKMDDLSSIGINTLNYVGGIVADPDVSGKFWGVANEVLFSFTYDIEDNTFAITEELTFSKVQVAGDGNRVKFPRPILFAEEDGVDYIYIGFSENGNLCKIKKDTLKGNPNNVEYKKLLPDATNSSEIPIFYALGKDGCLYYLDGLDLHMINVTPTDDEWTAASGVDQQIAELLNADELDIVAAATVYAEYNKLSGREKSLVTNITAFNEKAVAALKNKINIIETGSSYTGADIKAAVAIYDTLSWSEASKITNYYALLKAEYDLENQPDVVQLTKTDNSVTYYKDLQGALSAATAGGTVKLLANIEQDTVNVPAGVALDLNSKTLTVDSIAGCVMDSGNGNGLIQVDAQGAALKSPSGQLILWDNGASGYRVFAYTFESKGLDANKTDAAQSTETKSFWSELCFTNRNAYKLVASGRSGLEVGFNVSWTPNGGTAASNSCVVDPNVVAQWGEVEALDTANANAYYFYISITGFKNLKQSGLLSVTPVIQDIFNDATTAADIDYDYERSIQDVINILECDLGYGNLPEGLA